jgi:DNA-binding NarL/FixJ family response regulator
MKKIKLIIADDHPIFLKGLNSIIAEDNALEIIGEALNGEQALNLIKLKKPDIAILDIDMPILSGIEVAKKVKELKLETEIVILTIHKDKVYFDKAIEYGIKAYLLKQNVANNLIECLKKVAENEYYIGNDLSKYLIENIKEKYKKEEINTLTNTEREILKLVGENLTSSQIAEKKFISKRTVENHKYNICKKLNLQGPHALLLYAIQHKSNL